MCGFCIESLSCGIASDCLLLASECPLLASISPTSGPDSGDLPLTITLQNFDLNAWVAAVAAPQLACVTTYSSLATFTTPASILSATTVGCMSPPADVTGQPALLSVVAVSSGASLTEDPILFSFYRCAQESCGACANGNGCGWCVTGGFCGSASSCSTQVAGDYIPSGSSSACPKLVDFAENSPRQGASDGGTALTFVLSYLAEADGTAAAPSYQCGFSGLQGAPLVLVSASRLSSTLLSCASPMQSSKASATSSCIVYKGQRPYASSSLLFAYYNCSAAVDCASCTSSILAECAWCTTGSRAECASILRCNGTAASSFSRSCLAQAFLSRSPAISPMAISLIVVALVVTCVVLLLAAVYLSRSRATKTTVPDPPKLTPKLRRALVFGGEETPAVAKERISALRAFQNLLTSGTAASLRAGVVIALATPITEADRVAAALVQLYAASNLIFPFMCALVSAEVRSALSINTLFRTNSMATKTFKVLSKLRGLDYLSVTLGRVLNEALAKHAAEVEVDAERAGDAEASSEVAVNRFKLLSVCQSVVLQIFRSRSDVPAELAAILAHVHGEASRKFAVSVASLETNIGDALHAANVSIDQTSFQAHELRAAIERECGRVRGAAAGLGSTAGQGMSSELDRLLEASSVVVASLNEDYEAIRRAVEDLNAATDPQSLAARRIVERMQKSIVAATAGGFWFLRFLVPSVTAPVAYGLVAKTLTPQEQRLLVLVAKVLQNLSNGVQFGAKEAYMIGLNQFIVSNENDCVAFLTSLTVACTAPPVHPLPADAFVEVPAELVTAAVVQLADLITQLGPRFAVNAVAGFGSGSEDIVRESVAAIEAALMDTGRSLSISQNPRSLPTQSFGDDESVALMPM
eukprot:c14868_g1_i1.p1 GENE.c14868_g1_i1~~c14868_g1_i1.p1  ORF type:complete len:1008 (+),score=143.47 c14868_g1_i1:414-3026(+)